MDLRTLSLLTLLAIGPAAAQEELSGRVVRDGDRLVLRAGRDGPTRELSEESQRQVSSLVGQVVRVEGGAHPDTPDQLTITRFVDPTQAHILGAVEEHDHAIVICREGKTDVRLGGPPQELLQRLVGRKVSASGWLFGGDARPTRFLLVSVEGRVSEPGWLSQRLDQPDGTTRTRHVTNVSPGDNVRVIGLSAYDVRTKVWRPIADLQPTDTVMVRARIGMPRPGEPSLEGWIPLRKVDIGEPVAAPAAEQQEPAAGLTTTLERAQQQLPQQPPK